MRLSAQRGAVPAASPGPWSRTPRDGSGDRRLRRAVPLRARDRAGRPPSRPPPPGEMGREYKAIVDAFASGRTERSTEGRPTASSSASIRRASRSRIWASPSCPPDPGIGLQRGRRPLGRRRRAGRRGPLVRLPDGDGQYESAGMLHVNRTPYYAWLAYEAESMVAGPDGTLFIGETNRTAHLISSFSLEMRPGSFARLRSSSRPSRLGSAGQGRRGSIAPEGRIDDRI